MMHIKQTCTQTQAKLYVTPSNDVCLTHRHQHTHTHAQNHTYTHTLTIFVLCDQMMRVAMKLVTSIQQCPILFCSHPYCVTVLLMLCKHISSLCMSVTLHCSPMKYGCIDTLYVWEIITYYEILRREPREGDRYSLCIIHFSCF